MKKFFVLYSLKQKLTPTLYKTKITVAKHASTNKSLKFQQFDSQEQANTFIQKININTKTNQNTFLSENQINQILKTIVKKPINDEVLQIKTESNIVKKKTTEPILKKQPKDKGFGSWTILPNGRAMKVQKQEQKYDGSYSLGQQNQSNQRSKQTQQQSQSSIVSQQCTTQGMTQQGAFQKGNNKSLKRLQYWVLWNKNDFSFIELGKKKSQMGKLLFEMQRQNSSQWIKKNITTKQYKLKRDALKFIDQLKQKKRFYINQLKAEKLLAVKKQKQNNITKDQLNNNQNKLKNQQQTNQFFQQQEKVQKIQPTKEIGQPTKEIVQPIKENNNSEQFDEDIGLGGPIVFQQQNSKQKVKKKKKIQFVQPQFIINYDDIRPLQERKQRKKNKIRDTKQNMQRDQILQKIPQIKQQIKQQKQIAIQSSDINRNQKIDFINKDYQVVQNKKQNNQKNVQKQQEQVRNKQIRSVFIGDKIEQIRSEQLLIQEQEQQKQQKKIILQNKQQQIQHTTIIDQFKQFKQYKIVKQQKQQIKQQYIKQIKQQKQMKQQNQNNQQNQIKQQINKNQFFQQPIQLNNKIQTIKQQKQIIKQQKQIIKQQKQIIKQWKQIIKQKQQFINKQNKQQHKPIQQIQQNLNQKQQIRQQQINKQQIRQQQINKQQIRQQQINKQKLQNLKTFKPFNYKYIHPYNKLYIRQLINNKSINQFQQFYHSNNQLSTNQSPINILSTNKQSIKQQQSHNKYNNKSYQQVQQQQQYEIYPSLIIKQSPGFSIGQYKIKGIKSGKIIKQQNIMLGQTKKQQAHLLTIAFSLSSINYIHQFKNHNKYYKSNNNNNNFIQNNINNQVSNISNNNNNSIKNNNNNSPYNNKKIKIHLNEQMNRTKQYNYKFDKTIIDTKLFLQQIQNKFKYKLQYVI